MTALINSAWRWANRQTRPSRLLAKRARMQQERTPLVLVPPVMGTRLLDGEGHQIWGGVKQVFFGSNKQGDIITNGVLEELSLLPGVLGYDVFGGLLHFLEKVGGYSRGEDLFVLDYDWRQSVVDGARALHTLIARIQGFSDQQVDLACVSSGGLVGRYYLGYGEQDVLRTTPGGDSPDSMTAGARKVRRVVYLGVPQRGVMESVIELEYGLKLTPLSRRVPSDIISQMQVPFDMLPHPDDTVFLDRDERPLDLDLYDGDVWRSLGLQCAQREGFDQRLNDAAGLHRALDVARPHPSTFAICARHKPTPARALVSDSGIVWPCCLSAGHPQFDVLNHSGDGAVPETSLSAVPGLSADKIWWLKPRQHRLIASDVKVHACLLEALLSTERVIHSDLYPLRKDSSAESNRAL